MMVQVRYTLLPWLFFFLCGDFCCCVLDCWCVLDPVPLEAATDLDGLALVQDLALPDLDTVSPAVGQLSAAQLNRCDLVIAV